MLGFLDAIKDLKTIPDVDVVAAITIFRHRIKNLNKMQQREIVQYALLYPPRVRAIVGAILEQLNQVKYLKILKESINPLSKFKIGLKNKTLIAKSNWNGI